jgi:hypothetical protein
MNTIEVLRYGTPVRLVSVDRYGFCGRDLHPREEDEGFLGIVVGNSVSICKGLMLLDHKENVLGGTELPYDDSDDDPLVADVCYKVRASDGRELELMFHEIEVLS